MQPNLSVRGSTAVIRFNQVDPLSPPTGQLNWGIHVLQPGITFSGLGPNPYVSSPAAANEEPKFEREACQFVQPKDFVKSSFSVSNVSNVEK